MLIRNVLFSLCVTFSREFGVVWVANTVCPLCHSWRQSVCTVHLFWFVSLSFSFQIGFGFWIQGKLFMYFVSLIVDLHGYDVSECVLELCVYGCYISDLNIFRFNFFCYFLSCDFPIFFAFSIVFVHLWCLMRLLHAGKIKDKASESSSAQRKGSCLTSLLLSVCLSGPVCLPEWIHPLAYRCPLWQCQCGHTPAEPRGSSGFHSEGRIPYW